MSYYCKQKRNSYFNLILLYMNNKIRFICSLNRFIHNKSCDIEIITIIVGTTISLKEYCKQEIIAFVI